MDSIDKLLQSLESTDEALIQTLEEVMYRRKAFTKLKQHAESEQEKENFDVLIEEFDKLSDFIQYRLMNSLSSK
jgi:predicted ATPase